MNAHSRSKKRIALCILIPLVLLLATAVGGYFGVKYYLSDVGRKSVIETGYVTLRGNDSWTDQVRAQPI